MSARMKRVGALVGGAAMLSFTGYALGSQAGDGVATSKTGPAKTASANAAPGRFGGPGARGLEVLAGKLGVDASKLEQALADIRAQQKPPTGDPRDRFAIGLAAKLGIDASKVKDALGTVRPERGKRHGRDIAAKLAKELGVDQAKVQAALDKVRPDRNGGPRNPDQFLSDLATGLGVSKDKLDAALKKVRPAGPRGPGRPGPGPGGKARPGPGGPGRPGHAPGGPAGANAAALAKALGVDPAKLQTALDEMRKEFEAEHAKRRDEFAQALADKLGIDVAKVKAALPVGPPHHERRGP